MPYSGTFSLLEARKCYHVTMLLLLLIFFLKPTTQAYTFVPGGSVMNVHEEVTYMSSMEPEYRVYQGGYATWYGNEFHGRLAADGSVYDQWGLTAASNTYPLGTRLRVIHNGKSVDVTITDRGGFTHALDLSRGAFNAIADESEGVIYIEFSEI